MDTTSCLTELVKIGTISQEQAERSYNRLETLERNKPTAPQVLRYGAIGAIAYPGVRVLENAISGKTLLEGTGWKDKMRRVAGRSIAGAVTSGAIPLLRTHFDRKAEVKHLTNYLQEHRAATGTPAVAPPAATPPTISPPATAKVAAPRAYARYGRRAINSVTGGLDPRMGTMLEQNAQQHAMGYVVQPRERNKVAAPVTPQGRLSAAMRVGTPRLSAPPGPSIAQVAKPVGYGRPLAGAKKTGI